MLFIMGIINITKLTSSRVKVDASRFSTNNTFKREFAFASFAGNLLYIVRGILCFNYRNYCTRDEFAERRIIIEFSVFEANHDKPLCISKPSIFSALKKHIPFIPASILVTDALPAYCRLISIH